MNKEQLPVIEVPASGKPGWMGGAWCLVFVYSTKGNFLLKGFIEECEKYIKDRNWQCWAIYQLHHGKSSPHHKENFRTIINTYGCKFEIYGPYFGKRRSSKDWKFTIWEKGNSSNRIYIKRLPKVFREFNLPGVEPVKKKKNPNSTLEDNPQLQSLKDKLDN